MRAKAQCSTPDNWSSASASAKLQGLKKCSSDPIKNSSRCYCCGQFIVDNQHPTERLWHAWEYKESCVFKLLCK